MFVAKGWELVDSDYSSAELFIAAYLSGDKQLLFAIEQRYDLHSYSSFLIFGQMVTGGSAEPVGKPPTKEAADLRKSLKPFVLYFTVPE
jgi:hypothetical protein